jgi:4-amino-4-deoxy-L-arabinose transferase-like glycosyltransferase
VGRSLSGILLHFFLFATLFAFFVPVFEVPDEPAHLAYINFLAGRGELPNQFDPARAVPEEGHQPPLYYALGAFLCRIFVPDGVVNVEPVIQRPPGSDLPTNIPIYRHMTAQVFPSTSDQRGFYLLRMMSVSMGLLNLLCIYLLALRILQDKRWTFVPVAFAATLPQFMFISGGINNDNLANLLSTVCLYRLYLILETPEKGRGYLWSGIFLGLGLITKKTLLFIVPGILLVAFYLLWKRKVAPAALLKNLSLLFGVALLLSGWWYLRNAQLYGDWLGMGMERQTLPHLVDEKSLFSRYFLKSFWLTTGVSFIASFGWMNVTLPSPVFGFYFLVIFAGVAGFLMAWHKGRDVSVPFLIALISLCVGGVVYYNLTYTQPQGRFLFPVLSLITIAIALGWREVLRVLPERKAWRIMRVMLLLCILTNLVSLIVIQQFYYRQERYEFPLKHD